MDNESGDDDDHAFEKFGFCNVGSQHELDLRNMLKIDNQSNIYLL